MVSFLALYRGRSVASAELVAVSADPDLVGRYADELLDAPASDDGDHDSVLREVHDGRRRALQLVREEVGRPAEPGDSAPGEGEGDSG